MSPDGFPKPPPEEKLLRLIRGKGPKASVPAASPQAAATGTTRRVLRRAPARTQLGVGWLKMAMGCLVLILCLEGAYLVVEATRPVPSIEVPTNPADSPGNSPPPLEPEAVPSLAASASRQLFEAPAVAAPAPSEITRPALSESAKLLASRLTLMGIVSGDPAQAIIQDSQTGKTYFVTTGQSLAEGALLEQVLDNRVILDVGGERIELAL